MAAEDPTTPENHNGEKWRPVPDWPAYEVSDHGRVRSLPRRLRHGHMWKGKILRGNINAHGYLRVTLCFDGRFEECLVHVLVLNAFVGLCPAGMECRHLDGDPGNPRLENLAWGTHRENMADQIAHGTRAQGVAHGRVKLSAAQVQEIRALRGEFCYVTAARFGISKQHVSRIRRGEKWTALTELPALNGSGSQDPVTAGT